MRLEILTETIADGRITWQSRDNKSAIDYVQASTKARATVTSMSEDEEECFNIDSCRKEVLEINGMPAT